MGDVSSEAERLHSGQGCRHSAVCAVILGTLGRMHVRVQKDNVFGLEVGKKIILG